MKNIFKTTTLFALPLITANLLTGCGGVGAEAREAPTSSQNGLSTVTGADSAQEFTPEQAYDLANTALSISMADPLDSYVPKSNEANTRSAIATYPTENQIIRQVHSGMFSRLLGARFMPNNSAKFSNAAVASELEQGYFFAGWGYTATTNCTFSGTMKVNILDWNNNGQMDAGERGEEIYTNCNDGNSIIDGLYAVNLKEAVFDDALGEYTTLSASFGYTDFAIGTQTNTITYNGTFEGKVINQNARTLKVYNSINEPFNMTDKFNNSMELTNFNIQTIIFDATYGKANLRFDTANPPLAPYTSIDQIPTLVNLAGTTSDPTLLANTYKFEQTYSFRSSDQNITSDPSQVVEVATVTPFIGIINTNPTQGEVNISKVGGMSNVSVNKDNVTVRSGVTSFTETVTYSWSDFNSLLDATIQ